MTSFAMLLISGLLALAPCLPFDMDVPGYFATAGPAVSAQEPEDPGRVLNLLNGLIERVQKSSPLLAAIIRFLSIVVYLVLHIKVWGPSALVTLLLVVAFLVWQGRKKKMESPPTPEYQEEGEM